MVHSRWLMNTQWHHLFRAGLGANSEAKPFTSWFDIFNLAMANVAFYNSQKSRLL